MFTKHSSIFAGHERLAQLLAIPLISELLLNTMKHNTISAIDRLLEIISELDRDGTRALVVVRLRAEIVERGLVRDEIVHHGVDGSGSAARTTQTGCRGRAEMHMRVEMCEWCVVVAVRRVAAIGAVDGRSG